MKRFILLIVLTALVGLSIGCSGANLQSVPIPAPTAAAAFPMQESKGGAMPRVMPEAPPAPASGDTSTANQAQADTRMIVYTGDLSLQVNDTADTINKTNEILKNVNGYIASKSVVAYGKDKLRGTISVRIPAAALDTTLTQIKALAVKVLSESANSNDVTAEYVDLDARRKNLEVYEVELQKMLETERERPGSKAEDLLAIYNQLTDVRGQIEQIKGRQKYLENTSALATYNIEFVPIEEPVVEGKPGWDPGKVFTESLDALVGALQALVDLLIRFLVVILPILIILFLPVVLFILFVRWLWKRRQAKKPTAAK